MFSLARMKDWLGVAMASVTLSLAGAGANAQPKAPLEASELGAYFDGYLAAELERADIAGAALVVVKDGRVLLQRGYGWADREHKVPVSPETTLFRIGSVSKLLTWTAVMQLVEQGRLSLDTDVQRYLDFPMPPYQGQPVTLRRLMTHTAGFEETVQGMWMQPGEPPALGDYLRRQLPPRIFPAGEVVAYSNYGATLAGYIVERRSGEPFEAYVQRHLLDPLGMAHTSFAQPLPAAIAPMMSQGYDEGSGKPQGFEWLRVAPAGSASASAADMARFMLAHLGGTSSGGTSPGGGSPGGDAVPPALSPAMLTEMHAPQWLLQAGSPAMTLGFWELGGFGSRVISHGGDTMWFHSGLYLVPEKGVGVFFVQNSAGKRVLRDAVFRRFAERYLDAPVPQPASTATTSDAGIEGSYVGTRRAEHNPLKLGSLLSQVTVTRDAEGRLRVSSLRDANDHVLPLRPVGAGAWQSEEATPRQVRFRRDANGAWSFGQHVPVVMWQQVPWYRSARVTMAALAASAVAMAWTLLAWPGGALLRVFGWQASPPTPAGLRLRRATRWTAFMSLLPWLVIVGLMAAFQGDANLMASDSLGRTLRVVQAASWLALAALALAAWWPWRSTLRGAGGWRRAHHALIVTAGLAATWVAWQGGLLIWDGRF